MGFFWLYSTLNSVEVMPASYLISHVVTSPPRAHAQGRRYVRAHLRATNWDACMCVYI